MEATAVACNRPVVREHILPEQFTQLMDECSQIAAVLHRQVPRGIHVEESAGVAVTAR